MSRVCFFCNNSGHKFLECGNINLFWIICQRCNEIFLKLSSNVASARSTDINIMASGNMANDNTLVFWWENQIAYFALPFCSSLALSFVLGTKWISLLWRPLTEEELLHLIVMTVINLGLHVQTLSSLTLLLARGPSLTSSTFLAILLDATGWALSTSSSPFISAYFLLNSTCSQGRRLIFLLIFERQYRRWSNWALLCLSIILFFHTRVNDPF